MMGLFTDIYVPAIPVLARLEQQGIPLDIVKREQFRRETIERLAEAEKKVAALAQDFHEKRRVRIEEAQAKVERDLAATLVPEIRGIICRQHTDYLGLTKRKKCEACKAVFDASAGLRAEVKDLKGRISRAKALLKRLGPTFQPRNDHHWRWLLFDKTGLGLRPSGFTGKTRVPAVDDDAIDRLQKRHPEIEILRLRVEVKRSEARLTRRLGMVRWHGGWDSDAKAEPDQRGRLHFAYSMHRSSMCRLASGADEEEEGKERASVGNLQNVPETDREMYVSEPGYKLISADWSQIEARDFAWRADERKMLAAWQKGLDIHTVNALAIARAIGFDLDPAKADSTPFPNDPSGRSFRQAGKLTHKLHYGMGAEKFSRDYQIPLSICTQIIEAYFNEYPRLRPFQQEVIALATQQRVLRNSFGAKLWFHNFERDRLTGEWVISDREEALAFGSQSNVALMCIAMLPTIYDLAEAHGGELLTTTHDSFLVQVPERQSDEMLLAMKKAMEREWPQLGEKEGFGLFRCPADFKVGYNWAPARADNQRGLMKWK